MELYIQSIEEVQLPNYIETIWSSGESHTRQAPLLAKYRVDLITEDRTIELFFEVREQPSGYVLIDEYYEDQVYNSLMGLLPETMDSKARSKTYSELEQRITDVVLRIFEGSETDFPIYLLA